MKYLLKNNLKLCLVTNIGTRPINEYKFFLCEAIKGGVTMVQLREKSASIDEVKYKAIELQKILKPLKIPLIINNFVELAAEINADGIHIGQKDMPVEQAKKILGLNKIIGLSIESMEQLEIANNTVGISYVTASAVFPSKTKPDCKKIWGLDGLKQVALNSKHPVTAIGGIKSYNVADFFKIPNVYGVAVVGAIENSLDPRKAAEELLIHSNLRYV
ncbi:MAG: thiamine phosphate synthase [Alphaproteobacteria bacterium]